MTGQRLLTINLAKVTLPFMFSRLLHEEVVKNEALDELREIFAVLEFCERAAQTDKAVGGALKGMVWPSMVFCREILIELAATGFRVVPEHVEQAILAFTCGMEGTYMIEELANFLKGKRSPCTGRARWGGRTAGI